MTLNELKAEVVKAGYTVSAGSWEDKSNRYAFSKEAYPGCYGHPLFTAHYCVTTGWLTVGSKSVKISDRRA